MKRGEETQSAIVLQDPMLWRGHCTGAGALVYLLLLQIPDMVSHEEVCVLPPSACVHEGHVVLDVIEE